MLWNWSFCHWLCLMLSAVEADEKFVMQVCTPVWIQLQKEFVHSHFKEHSPAGRKSQFNAWSLLSRDICPCCLTGHSLSPSAYTVQMMQPHFQILSRDTQPWETLIIPWLHSSFYFLFIQTDYIPIWIGLAVVWKYCCGLSCEHERSI